MITDRHDPTHEQITLDVRRVQIDGHTLVVAVGEIDADNIGPLRAALCDSASGCGQHRLVIDLGGVTFFDAATVNLLIEVAGGLERRGGKLWLAGITTFGRRVLDLTGLRLGPAGSIAIGDPVRDVPDRQQRP